MWQGRPWHYRLKIDAGPDRNHLTNDEAGCAMFTKLWDLRTAAPGVKVMAVVFKKAVATAQAELKRQGFRRQKCTLGRSNLAGARQAGPDVCDE